MNKIDPKNTILIAAGGTGGHIFPALAIAKEIEHRYPHCVLLFVGASDRMEMEKIPAAGYSIKGLWISGFQRSFSLKNLLLSLKHQNYLSLILPGAEKNIIRSFRPIQIIPC